jgi:hypothetical protein
MKHKQVRIAISILAAFIALSAIGGGVAMLVSGMQFPLEWLRNTPFRDYTIPALVLAIVVGGSALLAAVSIFSSREVGVLMSLVAGLIMAGYEVVEVVTIKQVYWLQGVYFGLGLVIFGLAAFLWMAEDRRHPVHSKHPSHA